MEFLTMLVTLYLEVRCGEAMGKGVSKVKYKAIPVKGREGP
jgi:hypothetical protein